MFLCMYVGLFIFYDMFSLLLSVSVSLCCYCMYMFTSVTSSSFVLPCLHFMCLTVYMYDSICMVGMCPHISMYSYRSIWCDFHTMFFSVYTFSYCVLCNVCVCVNIHISFILCSTMFFPVHTFPYYAHTFPYYVFPVHTLCVSRHVSFILCSTLYSSLSYIVCMCIVGHISSLYYTVFFSFIHYVY